MKFFGYLAAGSCFFRERKNCQARSGQFETALLPGCAEGEFSASDARCQALHKFGYLIFAECADKITHACIEGCKGHHFRRDAGICSFFPGSQHKAQRVVTVAFGGGGIAQWHCLHFFLAQTASHIVIYFCGISVLLGRLPP